MKDRDAEVEGAVSRERREVESEEKVLKDRFVDKTKEKGFP